MHELGHLVGFYHEHQRPDRDYYIAIDQDNIYPGYEIQFQKKSFTTYGEYDFNSIMHYSLGIYSKNTSKNTMNVLKNVTVPANVRMGHLHTLSVGDYTKARLMYQCPASKCACSHHLGVT
jgi:hypothetical protein